MIIQHNIPAMNSHRNLGINNAATAKNLEKLSSGYKINRAGDDAAGLAISEKMRGQIRGLAMATQNAQNGVSLIQTAEGGLNETHAILQRMRELAVQSANGTYDDEVDRANISKEVQALKSEIDRIASSTNYNGIKLLDGEMGGKKWETGTSGNNVLQLGSEIKSIAGGVTANTVGTTQYDVAGIKEAFGDKTATFTLRDDGKIAMQVGDKTYVSEEAAAGTVFNFLDSDGNGAIEITFGDTIDAKANPGVIGNVVFDADGTAVTDITKVVVAGKKAELIFQIGANGTADQRVGLHVDNMSSGNIGVAGGKKISDIDISTRDEANNAIAIIDAATNQVSGTRADLGALQNRLEHTINNLGVTRENLQAAESSIRDVDMAKEMMEFTKNNILVQASQAMLAQANQLPQGVLQLLR